MPQAPINPYPDGEFGPRRVDYTTREAADTLGVCLSTIWLLIREGKLHSYQVRRARRIRWESVESLRRGEAA